MFRCSGSFGAPTGLSSRIARCRSHASRTPDACLPQLRWGRRPDGVWVAASSQVRLHERHRAPARAIPAFHTPSGAMARRRASSTPYGATFPASRRRVTALPQPRKLEREFSRASSKLPGRPSGGPSGLTGARQVSWLTAYRRRRLPRRDAQWRRCVGTPLTVAGAAAVRRNACRVPFSPSFVARDRAVFMFQLRWGLSNARRENRGPCLIDLNASDPVSTAPSTSC